MSLTETPLAGAARSNIANSSWDDGRIADLRRLWDAGLSAAQVAAALGGFDHCHDGGRSAVIGKIHRLGAEGRPKRTKPKPKLQTRHIARALLNRAAKAKQAPEVEAQPEPELFIPCGQRCTLLDLEPYDEKCRWPIGDPGSPDFFFCGGKAVGPYCAYHGRIAYEPRAARRDRRPARP